MHKATVLECRFLSNHHATVFLSATEDQVLNSRIEDLADVLLLVIYTVLRKSPTTAVGDKAKALQAERELLALLNMLPVYNIVRRYLGAIPSQELVRHRGLA